MLEPTRRDWFSAPMTPKSPRPQNGWPLSRLARDLGLLLIVKLALLTALWWAFFSHPVAPALRAQPQVVREHVFPGSTDPAPAAESVHAER
jgi:hypothetical protein